MQYMDIESIILVIDIIIRICVAIFLVVCSILVIKCVEYLKVRLSCAQYDGLYKLIISLCESADQQFKDEDTDGTIRNKYVKEQLVAMGYELTDEIIDVIESAVYQINLNQVIKEIKTTTD